MEWCHTAMPERQAGRQTGIKATQLQQGNFFSSLPPFSSFLPRVSSPLSPPLWTFSPLQRNVFHHLATWPGGQAGQGQTTCMQLGLAWRAAQKALKDRTGQDRVSQTGSRLALSLSSSLEAGRAAGRVQSRRECGRGTAVVARSFALSLSLSRSYANL